MKRIKLLCLTLGFASVLGAGVMAAPSVGAVDLFGGCKGDTSSEICKSAGKDSATKGATNIINTLLFIAGILAVIMIVIGGILYTISGGDSGKIKTAKDTILYSVVGLVVALLAFAIVNFVVSRF